MTVKRRMEWFGLKRPGNGVAALFEMQKNAKYMKIIASWLQMAADEVRIRQPTKNWRSLRRRGQRGGTNVREREQDCVNESGRKEATGHIVDYCTLLGLNAERHGPNLESPTTKTTEEPDLIYCNNIEEPHNKMTSIINEINFYII